MSWGLKAGPDRGRVPPSAPASGATAYAVGMPRPLRLPGFTLIELLVVIAVVALLLGLLLPALAGARRSAQAAVCLARLQQLGVAVTLYLDDHDQHLPQKLGPVGNGQESVIGTLFGGARGRLPFFGIDTYGAASRPLNPYLVENLPPDDDGAFFDLPAFRSPVDRGSEDTGVPIPGFERTDSMYELVGTSYTLNGHAPDQQPGVDAIPTLIPRGGGRMPYVLDISKTFVIATHPIYNYDDGGDRRQRWLTPARVEAGLVYLDAHARQGVPVPEGPVHTTPDYTFLPTPNWARR